MYSLNGFQGYPSCFPPSQSVSLKMNGSFKGAEGGSGRDGMLKINAQADLHCAGWMSPTEGISVGVVCPKSTSKHLQYASHVSHLQEDID